jgi:hypothetical protein
MLSKNSRLVIDGSIRREDRRRQHGKTPRLDKLLVRVGVRKQTVPTYVPGVGIIDTHDHDITKEISDPRVG